MLPLHSYRVPSLGTDKLDHRGFLAAVISAIRLDKGLALRLACSELIVPPRAPNYCKVTEIEQISTAKIVKVPGSPDIGHSEVSPAIGLRRPLSRAPQGDGPCLTAWCRLARPNAKDRRWLAIRGGVEQPPFTLSWTPAGASAIATVGSIQ